MIAQAKDERLGANVNWRMAIGLGGAGNSGSVVQLTSQIKCSCCLCFASSVLESNHFLLFLLWVEQGVNLCKLDVCIGITGPAHIITCTVLQ